MVKDQEMRTTSTMGQKRDGKMREREKQREKRWTQALDGINQNKIEKERKSKRDKENERDREKDREALISVLQEA